MSWRLMFNIPCLLIVSLWAVSKKADKLVLVLLWHPVIHQIWNVQTQEVMSLPPKPPHPCLSKERKKNTTCPGIRHVAMETWSFHSIHTQTQSEKKFDCFLTSAWHKRLSDRLHCHWWVMSLVNQRTLTQMGLHVPRGSRTGVGH